MPKFVVVDEAIINAPPLAVYKAILNEYSGVTHLWLPELEFKPRNGNPMDCVGAICDTKARRHGLTGRFSEKVTAIEPTTFIELELSGDFTGNEKWTFEPVEEGRTRAKVDWKGASNSLLLSLAARFVDVEKELHKSRRRFLEILQNTLGK